jgi:rhodanese-related sulfurtransferase
MQVAQLIVLSVLLALIYNSFAPKRIPLVRRVVVKVAVPDSALFGSPFASPGDSGKAQPAAADTGSLKKHVPDVKVIAPLHERALARGDTAPPPVEKKNVDTYNIITLSQFTRLLDAGHNMLIDARDEDAYKKARIKGARNIPGLSADKYFPELAPMPRDTMVLIYCNNPDCHLGRMVAEFMQAIGFKRLYLYDDGWDGWEKAKMPVDSSQAPGS